MRGSEGFGFCFGFLQTAGPAPRSLWKGSWGCGALTPAWEVGWLQEGGRDTASLVPWCSCFLRAAGKAVLVLGAEATVAQLDPLNDISKRSRCWGKWSQLWAWSRAPAGSGALRTSFFSFQSFQPQEEGNQDAGRQGAVHGQLFVIWI